MYRRRCEVDLDLTIDLELSWGKKSFQENNEVFPEGINLFQTSATLKQN